MVRAAALLLYRRFGLPGAGLIFLLEGLGVPIPVEAPLGIVGLRMSEGLNTYAEIVFLMWLTTMFGNTIGYLLGYYGGRPLVAKLMAWFRIRPEVGEHVEHWFQRYGLIVVIATRWVNWGFAQNVWLAGITEVPFGQFLSVMAVNDLLWAMAWSRFALAAVTYFQRRPFHFLHVSTMKLGLTAVVLVLLGSGAWWLIRWLQRRKLNRA